MLAEHFLTRHVASNGPSVRGISTVALRLLLQHDWPGTVRELAHAIGGAVLLETNGLLSADSLRQFVLAGGGPADGSIPADDPGGATACGVGAPGGRAGAGGVGPTK